MFKDFEGQQLDRDIITNTRADRISEGEKELQCYQLITNYRLYCFLSLSTWFGLKFQWKKYLTHYFLFWTDSKYHKTSLHNTSTWDFTKRGNKAKLQKIKLKKKKSNKVLSYSKYKWKVTIVSPVSQKRYLTYYLRKKNVGSEETSVSIYKDNNKE